MTDGSGIRVTGGRVIDPATGVDDIRDIEIGVGAQEAIDADGLIVVPGLIDLHTHVYFGGTSLGIDPDRYMRTAGVTTAIDTGSAGPGNFPGFRDHVIKASEARILALLHVSFAGIFGFDHNVMVGESENLALMAPRDAVRVAQENPDTIMGIKVRVGRHASGIHGLAPLEIALQVADQSGLPLMAHIDEPPPTYEAVLEKLRPGDILTHAFRPFPNAPLDGNDAVRDAVWAARARGVLFDIGHGMGSFSFRVARTMLEAGFLPDTISSDVHALCIDGPAFDLPTTMTKFLTLGMPLPEIIRAVTTAPAAAVRRPELGTFDAGDATLLRLEDRPAALHDTVGEVLTAPTRITVAGTIRAGRYIPSDRPDPA